MKILFYLPVVTPWWFHNIVLPLIETMAKDAEVHVLVAPLWKNTGITAEQLYAARAVKAVQWHIVDDPQHPTLRTRPADAQGLIDFVRDLDPDYTFCRSADAETPSAFPGKVRYIMEPGAPPFPGIDRNFVLQKDLLRHGEMPSLTSSERDTLDIAFADIWKRFGNRFENQHPFAMNRETAFSRMGINPRRKVVALTLEYAHAENFFRIHETHDGVLALLRDVTRRLDDDTVLAVTDHPLNYLHHDNSAVYRALEALGPKTRLVRNTDGSMPRATDILLKHCDGAIVQNSKSIYCAAYFGKPILRLANVSSASWLNDSTDIERYFDQLRTGTAPVSKDNDVRTWFGMRLIHDVIDPLEVSARELIDRIELPFDPGRLADGLERFERMERGLS